jgi:hypothetical protein
MPGWRSRITIIFLGDFGDRKNKPIAVIYLISFTCMSETNNQSDVQGNQNIVLQGITDSQITLNVGGDTQTLRNDISELKTFLESQNSEFIEIGGKAIPIGETEVLKTVIAEYEKDKKRKKLILFTVLPILLIALAYLGYQQYQVSQKPLSLTIKLENQTPNPNLPEPTATLSLKYGDKIAKTENITEESMFKGIPSSFKGEMIQLAFKAKGFVSRDTSFILAENFLSFPVFRDNSLGKVFGMVKDEDNRPLEGVKIAVQNIQVLTDGSGAFSLSIPFGKQATEQRVSAFKDGYDLWDRTVPIFNDVETKIILTKQE